MSTKPAQGVQQLTRAQTIERDLNEARVGCWISANGGSDWHYRERVENTPHQLVAIDRHGNAPAKVAVPEERMRRSPGGGIPKIESQENVVHPRHRYDTQVAFTVQPFEVRGPQPLHQIGFSALEPGDRRGEFGH